MAKTKTKVKSKKSYYKKVEKEFYSAMLKDIPKLSYLKAAEIARNRRKNKEPNYTITDVITEIFVNNI